MRVLQISKFFPPVCGGIEAATRDLAEGLAAAGVPGDVLCCNLRPRTEEQRAKAGYRVVRAASAGRLLSTSMAPALVGLVGRMAPGYDLLHVHMPDPMAALALRRVRPAARIVLHWHSDVVRQRLAMRLYAPLQRWLLERADAVVATSPPYGEASDALRPWRRKVEVIPLGIGDNLPGSCDDRAAALRARHAGKKIVFALGRMASYKGFEVLIDAAARLPEESVVLIGGEGPLLARCRAQVARLGLGRRVLLLGALSHEDVIAYLHTADVFCMPSTTRAEAFGIAMVEAMSMGRPVVASDIPGSGVPWVNRSGETGLNVPARDPQALAAALAGLLADGERAARYGAAARARYLSHFTAAAMTARFIDLYRRLLAG